MKKFKLVKEKGYFQSLRETKSVQALEDGAVEISGYASTKDKDRGGDIVEPKAFQSALERYMTNPIVLLQHKADKPIGIVEEADIDENGLFIKAKISQNTDGVIDLIKNGVLRAFSIGYSVKEYDTDVKELADGTYDMTNIIKDLELYEISVVSVPMNPYALSKSVEDLLEVEEENEEQSETEEVEEVEEEKVEENEEEKAIDDGAENDQNEEKDDEGVIVQDEEKNDEIETDEPKEIEEEQKELPNEEVEVQETCEEESEATNEESSEVEEKADEQSEIDEESVEEDSENADETPADDEVVDETSNDEIIETKSIDTESKKEFDFKSEFAMFQKSFDEKLAMKDKEIEDLKSKVDTMTKLFADSLETIDRMTTAVKNTPVASGLQYKRPLKKGGYYDVASIIKNL